MNKKLKVGDKVKVVFDDSGGKEWIGKTGTITHIGDGAYNHHPIKLDISTSTYFAHTELKLVSKCKPEDLTKYMVYGTGCDNTSDLFVSEKEMKREMKVVAQDSSWDGRIIGYKLVPLYEAETKVVLKTIKPIKAKKK